MKYIKLIHAPASASGQWENIMDIPGGPRCVKQGTEKYRIMVGTDNYYLTGFHNLQDLVKSLGMGWRKRYRYVSF